MTQRTALVTGGTGGIGTAIVRYLAQQGHKVVTNYRDEAKAEAWRKTMAQDGLEATLVPGDVADPISCENMINAIHHKVGPVDILVNNAGITRDGRFLKMTQEDWETVMHTDLDSMFNVTKSFCAGMVERGWGRIVNIGSINGTKGQFGQCNYAAAKAGIHGFTESLALEVARHGVTVNTVSPGYTDTHMVASVPKDVLESKVIPLIPVGRLGRPEEIAALVAFVCSEAAAFMTGSNLAINGGQHMY